MNKDYSAAWAKALGLAEYEISEIARLEKRLASLREKRDQIIFDHMRAARPTAFCHTCAHAKIAKDGRRVERGWLQPCVSCKRPYLSNWKEVDPE